MVLTTDQWNALSAEEQVLQADDMPQELKGKGNQQPTVEDVKKLTDQVKGLTTKLEAAVKATEDSQRANSGIYGDLKKEREIRQKLTEKVEELEAAGGGGGGEGDTYLTTASAKKLLDDAKKDMSKQIESIRDESAKERETADESRMKEMKDLPIPYLDAVKVFEQMAKSNHALYKQYVDECNRPGGKPAELAYKITLRDHPEFVALLDKKTREGIIKDITKTGKIPKLPSGGAGGGTVDYDAMSPDELVKLPDDVLGKLAKGETP